MPKSTGSRKREKPPEKNTHQRSKPAEKISVTVGALVGYCASNTPQTRILISSELKEAAQRVTAARACLGGIPDPIQQVFFVAQFDDGAVADTFCDRLSILGRAAIEDNATKQNTDARVEQLRHMAVVLKLCPDTLAGHDPLTKPTKLKQTGSETTGVFIAPEHFLPPSLLQFANKVVDWRQESILLNATDQLTSISFAKTFEKPQYGSLVALAYNHQQKAFEALHDSLVKFATIVTDFVLQELKTESAKATVEGAQPTTESATPATESATPATESATPTTESAKPTMDIQLRISNGALEVKINGEPLTNGGLPLLRGLAALALMPQVTDFSLNAFGEAYRGKPDRFKEDFEQALGRLLRWSVPIPGHRSIQDVVFTLKPSDEQLREFIRRSWRNGKGASSKK